MCNYKLLTYPTNGSKMRGFHMTFQKRVIEKENFDVRPCLFSELTLGGQ